MKKAVVLVSGGIDSAVALDWARERYRAIAVSYRVAGRPRGEARACAAVVRRAGVEHVRVDVPFLRPRPSGYAPARNLVFHSIALAIAEDRGAAAVVAGHNASDATFFEDARPAYFRKLEWLGRGVRILLPFARMTDAQVIVEGMRRGVPLGRTWSCYRDGSRPCGRCSACRGRIESFEQSGMEDPS
ncbi:MAG: 7-cyano-7-deazaguanine synthase [Planctomycetaceae bacterium]|nr:7-cyano-7-deazaguanine synthase [Planctomycetaceae bacterium]